MVVLGLMAAQATFFSPSKYGIVPELLPDGDLSRANGLLEMSTFVGYRPRHVGRRRAVRAVARSTVAASAAPWSRSPSLER